jgi:hypothetical protein
MVAAITASTLLFGTLATKVNCVERPTIITIVPLWLLPITPSHRYAISLPRPLGDLLYLCDCGFDSAALSMASFLVLLTLPPEEGVQFVTQLTTHSLFCSSHSLPSQPMICSGPHFSESFFQCLYHRFSNLNGPVSVLLALFNFFLCCWFRYPLWPVLRLFSLDIVDWLISTVLAISCSFFLQCHSIFL